ncbi:winged helix-turn-helix transcriptional regulator [Streptomyces solicathayae]|uniref:Winged helix-turn-helix transcriptional regulator n=1 Tax=Streptomyces solicathayae TaxID=3081768 RepID=A0ABZ0LVP9_9ACTN|nr:winged helix-turn-helix transcriptional regulator [Streptomyces sp. HUAS YS2]WOX22858.1 winged helix-turn-helix transcriptional regulator [Streptomyces sp. HUAS YS2]
MRTTSSGTPPECAAVPLPTNQATARTVTPTSPPRVDYALTPVGATLSTEVASLIAWSERGRETENPLPPRRKGVPELGGAAGLSSRGASARPRWPSR